MWLPVDLVLAALLSSTFELAWVAERGGLSADGDPSDLDTDSSYVPALAPSPAPAFSSRRRVMARARASAHRSPDSRAGRPSGRRGRRSNRCSDWRLVTATSVRAHSADRRPGAGHRARRPRAGPNQARLMRMLPSGYSPGSREPATTPPRALAKIVCTHNGDPRRAHGGNLHPCRRKSVATAAFRRSPARLNHRHVPGKHQSPGPWRRNATPQQVSGTLVCSYRLAAVTWTTEPTCSSATSMPIELGRRSTSSTNGGRRTPDVLRPGPPRRLPTPTRRTPRRRRDAQTRSPRVRVAARRGCAVWRDHDDESAHHSTVYDTGALHRGDVGRPVPLRLPQRRGVAGERG